jgi:hypothetical protein
MGEGILDRNTLLGIKCLKTKERVSPEYTHNVIQQHRWPARTKVFVKKSTANGLALGKRVANGRRLRNGRARM